MRFWGRGREEGKRGEDKERTGKNRARGMWGGEWLLFILRIGLKQGANHTKLGGSDLFVYSILLAIGLLVGTAWEFELYWGT